MTELTQTQQIQRLNDQLRQTAQGGEILITQGIAALDFITQCEVMQKVKFFTDFSRENDPYQEHDFGSFTHKNVTYFWKIDYYDVSMTMHSENPANPDITRRVLTILLASEY